MENISYYTELIQRYLDGSAVREDLLELLQWLKVEEEHVRYFNQISNAWEGGDFSADNERHTDLALLKLHKRIDEVKALSGLPNSNKNDTTNRFWWFARVAAVMSGLVLIISVFLFLSKLISKDQPLRYATVISPPSQKSQLVLPDGTVVWLNSGSTLRYSTIYGDKKREVYLEGEGFFKVAKNASKPFLVHASSLIVKALGTSFNVKCYAEDKTIETTLVEGKVEVSSTIGKSKNNPKVILAPNDKLTFMKSTQSSELSQFHDEKSSEIIKPRQNMRTEKVSIATVISWKEQILVFEDESFENLVKRLERWYDVKITIQNESLYKNSYTGKFANHESIEQIFNVISRTTPLHFTIKNKTITIN